MMFVVDRHIITVIFLVRFAVFLVILHNEANKIRNYKKHKLNEDNDYNKRDYLFNHIYYSGDYETVVTDDYDDNV